MSTIQAEKSQDIPAKFQTLVKLEAETIQQRINQYKAHLESSRKILNDNQNAVVEAGKSGDITAILNASKLVNDAEALVSKASADVEMWETALLYKTGGTIPVKPRGKTVELTPEQSKAKNELESIFRTNKILSTTDIGERSWVITSNGNGFHVSFFKTQVANKTATKSGVNKERTTNHFVAKPEFGGGDYSSLNRMKNGTATLVAIPMIDGESDEDYISRVVANQYES